MSTIRSLKQLWIWQEAQNLTDDVHKMSKKVNGNFPWKDQIDRSSQGVADNIAEMHGSYYYNNKIKGLYDARKEALETVNHIEKFRRRKLWPEEVCEHLTDRYDKLLRGINAYIKHVAKWRDNEKKSKSKDQ